MKKVTKWACMAAVVSMAASACTAPVPKAVAAAPDSIKTAPLPPVTPPLNWTYQEEVDQMTDGKKYFAYCESPTSLDFKFPYDGGSTATLILRHIDDQSDVLLTVSKGQFVGSVLADRTVKLKFDNDAPVEIPYVSPSDGSANAIFLDFKSPLVERLKKAEQLKIEAEFFNEGLVIMDFKTTGLTWER
ncbi:hypothetical protein ACWKWU_07690 [Chitinophaga lutea]